MSSYKIIVEFTRDAGDDSNVIESEGKAFNEYNARVQFCREMQAAYDELQMAGSFKILKIEGFPK